MKFTLGIIVLAVGSILISSCSEETPNQHKQLYMDTVDSLKLCQDLPLVQAQLDSIPEVKDYLSLTFEEFKRKHKTDDDALDVLSKSLQTTIEIAKAFQSVQENMLEIEALDRFDSDTSLRKEDYSFNRPLDIPSGDADTNFINQVLMESEDYEVQK